MSLLAPTLAVLRARIYLRHAERLGTRVRVIGRPVVDVRGGRLLVGDRVKIVSTPARTEVSATEGGTLAIGHRAFVNFGCSIVARRLVQIGPRCSLGPHAILWDNDLFTVDPDRRHERPESRPIVLEENVWLGGSVIVLAGVTIGADSAIAAGSVVTRDVPPRSLAGGRPARVIRRL